MALLDALAARIAAIVAGTYPAAPSDPYIPAGTFAAGGVFLPAQNPRFPSTAIVERRFDLVWERLGFDPQGSENSTQGPWNREADLLIRVQYKIVQAPALAPTSTELVLGALEAASRKALNDAALIQWALLRPTAFTGIATGALLGDATPEKSDSQRMVGIARVRFLLPQSIVTAPGV